MDIKVFQKNMMRQIIKYVSKYITKKGSAKRTSTQEAVVSVVCSKIIRESEVVINIPCDLNSKISNPLKNVKIIQELAKSSPESKDIYYDSKYEIYLSRPDSLENKTYAEYFQEYDYEYKARKNDSSGIRDKKGRFIYKNKEDRAIMTNFSSTKNVNSQGYFMTKLFYPHRRDSDFIVENNRKANGDFYTNQEVELYFGTFKFAESFRRLVWEDESLRNRMEVSHAYKYIELLKQIQNYKKKDISSANSMSMIEQINKMFSEKKESLNLSELRRKLEKFDCQYAKCTSEQKKVMSVICLHLEEYFYERKVSKGIAIQGQGGTGKSFMIKLIKKLCKLLELSCAVLAPTGIAALNVKGLTYHSFFAFGKGAIKRINSKEYAHQMLKYEDLQKILLTDVLILDEMSMIGENGLNAINYCCQAAGMEVGINEKFGGKCVIMLGDFLQLPPVKQQMTYDSLFYSYFSDKILLEENQRAKTDEVFQAVLDCIRTGEIDDEVDRILKKRIWSKKCLTDSDIIYLFGKRKSVDDKNAEVLKDLGGQIIISEADESPKFEQILEEHKRPDWEDKYQRKLPPPRKLLLHKKGRYVLLKNIDKDFVNGSIVSVKFSNDVEICEEIKLKLIKNSNKKIRVKRHKYLIKFKLEGRKVHMHSLQFPIAPAFAMTIHKVQGMTLDRVVVDLSESDIFKDNQAYVAISRVRRLEDLFLINYRKTAFTIDRSVLEKISQFMPAREIDISEIPSDIFGKMDSEQAEVILDLSRDRFLDTIIRMQIPTVENSLVEYCHNPTSFSEKDLLIGKMNPEVVEERKAQIQHLRELLNRREEEFSKRAIQRAIGDIPPKKEFKFKWKGKRSRPKPDSERRGPPQFIKDIYQRTLQRKCNAIIKQIRIDLESRVVPMIQMKSIKNEIDPWIVTQITTPHKVQPSKYFRDNRPQEVYIDALDYPALKKSNSDIDDLSQQLEDFNIEPESDSDPIVRSPPRQPPQQSMNIDNTEELREQLQNELESITDYVPVIGLRNPGNTCYFNAIVQIFAALPLATTCKPLNSLIRCLRLSQDVPFMTLIQSIYAIPYVKELYLQKQEGETSDLLYQLIEDKIIPSQFFDNAITNFCSQGHQDVFYQHEIKIETRSLSIQQFFVDLYTMPCTLCADGTLPVQNEYRLSRYIIVTRQMWLSENNTLRKNLNHNFPSLSFNFEGRLFLLKALLCWYGQDNMFGHYIAKVIEDQNIFSISDEGIFQNQELKSDDWHQAFYLII